MPSAFVSGARGFVGQHLLRQLLQEGWSVTALRSRRAGGGELEHRELRWVSGDIAAANDVARCLDRPFDAVFHLAADTTMGCKQSQRQNAVNITGTANMLAAAKAAAVKRFIHTSSVSVYGFVNTTIDEQTEPDHGAYWINYHRSKARGEQLLCQAMDDGLNAVVLQPAHLMGPLDQHNWVRLFHLIAEQKLPAIPPGSGSFADVREVARAHLSAYHHGRSGETYLLGGENATFAELVGLIAATMEVPMRAKQLPVWMLKTLVYMKQMLAAMLGRRPEMTMAEAAVISSHEICDSSKAAAELGFRITPLPQLVADTVAWMREVNKP